MTEPVQVYDGDGLFVLDPKELHDQVWQAASRGVTTEHGGPDMVIDLTKPTPETVTKLEQIKRYLEKAEFLLANIIANDEGWGEVRVTSVEMERPDLWIVRGTQ